MIEEKTSKFAERLKEKLAGAQEPVHADDIATALVESQLDVVSGGHGSIHGSIGKIADTPEGGS